MPLPLARDQILSSSILQLLMYLIPAALQSESLLVMDNPTCLQNQTAYSSFLIPAYIPTALRLPLVHPGHQKGLNVCLLLRLAYS